MGEDKKVGEQFDANRAVTEILLDKGIVQTGSGASSSDYLQVSEETGQKIKAEIEGGQIFSYDDNDGPVI